MKNYKKSGKQRLKMYAPGGEVDPIDPITGKRLTAQQIRDKYKGNPYVTAGRETWGESLDAKLPLSGDLKVRDAIARASKTTGISPSLLYSSAMEEGLNLAIARPDDASEAYVEWSQKNPELARQYQIDGFYNYGLDTFGDQYKTLSKKGYLPEGFDKRFTVFPAFNEKQQKVNTAAFMSDEDALIAKAAMIKNTQDYLNNYSTKNKLNLTPAQMDFFTIAGYNAGLGNMEKMIKSYGDKGYLKDDGFLSPDFKPASYAGVYENVQRRLQNRNILDNEGFFATGGEATASAASEATEIPDSSDQGSEIVGLDVLKMLPNVADQIMSVLENNPKAYSRQPTLNADTMRQMVTPYGHFAMGGQAVPIEVEDNEVIETPDGKLAQMKGASHEEGGIDMNVPAGTKIYSDRLKIDGKSMQERKVAREKAIKRIERALIKNPGDKLLQGSYERTLETTGAEEAQDMALQKFLNKMFNSTGTIPESSTDMEFAYGGKVTYAGGGETDPYFDKTGWHNPLFSKNLIAAATMLAEEETGEPISIDAGMKFSPNMKKVDGSEYDWKKMDTPDLPIDVPNEDAGKAAKPYSGKLTLGDFIGIGGNAFNAIAPLLNSINNAAESKPNINRYLGFGREALETNEQAQGVASTLKSSQLTDIDTAANSSRMRNRNSAMSVNTLRALDTVTDINISRAKQSANDSFSRTLMDLLGQRGQLENIKDRMEMAGEERRDIEDKADRDNFYSNMAENLVNFGTNVQGIGKNLNTSHSNRMDAKLLSQLSQYGLGFDDEGNLITVPQKNS